MQRQDTHSKVIGYLLWIFGFLGAHRFYYGKPVTGTIWFFTLGLFFIGVRLISSNLRQVIGRRPLDGSVRHRDG